MKKPVDPERQLALRGKRALWKRINSPVIVPSFPADDCKERADAAVLAWIDDIFRYYDIDPASPERWEQAFWFLAPKAFPNFRIVHLAAGAGRPKTTAQRAELLTEFEGYRTRKRGSKYKHFLADHAAACGAARVKTVPGLKAAIIKARREREVERQGLELLLHDAAARALGINLHAGLKG